MRKNTGRANRTHVTVRILPATLEWLEQRRQLGGYRSLGAVIEGLAAADEKTAPQLFALFKQGRSFADIVLETGLSPATVREAHAEYVSGFETSPSTIARLPLAERLRDARAQTRADIAREKLEAQREGREKRAATALARARILAHAQADAASAATLTAALGMFAAPAPAGGVKSR
jgi:hypothetical protein